MVQTDKSDNTLTDGAVNINIRLRSMWPSYNRLNRLIPHTRLQRANVRESEHGLIFKPSPTIFLEIGNR